MTGDFRGISSTRLYSRRRFLFSSASVGLGASLLGLTRAGRLPGERGCGTTVQPSGSDDTAAIQSALNGAASCNGTVYLVGGATYRYSDWIYVPDGVTLAGQGSTRPLLLATRDGKIILGESSAAQFLHLRGPWDGGSLMQDPASLSPYNHGIDAGGDPGSPRGGWSISQCIIEYFVGAGINTGAYAPGITIMYNIISRNHNAGIQVGLHCDGPFIAYNTLSYNGFNGIDNHGTAPIVVWNECYGNGVVSVGCSCYEFDRNGILIAAIDASTLADGYVYGNTCYANYHHGIVALAASANLQSTTIAGNSCHTNGLQGIEANTSSGYSISDIDIDCNTLASNGLYGFRQIGNQFSGNCFLRGNTFSSNGAGAYFAPAFTVEPSWLCPQRAPGPVQRG